MKTHLQALFLEHLYGPNLFPFETFLRNCNLFENMKIEVGVNVNALSILRSRVNLGEGKNVNTEHWYIKASEMLVAPRISECFGLGLL